MHVPENVKNKHRPLKQACQPPSTCIKSTVPTQCTFCLIWLFLPDCHTVLPNVTVTLPPTWHLLHCRRPDLAVCAFDNILAATYANTST